MFKNYLITALRNIKRHKIFSFINIVGLAVGIASSCLIFLWIQDELSFDNFHKERQTIYRITTAQHIQTPAPLVPAILAEMPEVLQATRVQKLPRLVFKYGEKSFYEDKGLIVDPSFFNIFTFPFINGSLQTAFDNAANLILTREMAEKYFGDEDPIGKLIIIEGGDASIVSGVIENIPFNSHLKFDYIIPFKLLNEVRLYSMEWGDFNFLAYLKLDKNAESQIVTDKINSIAIKNNCPQVVNGVARFKIQPLSRIYLNPVGKHDMEMGNIKYIYVFSTIAILILFVACINFINLSTATSNMRAKEIGLRKVVGADRIQLFNQFFSEFLIVAFISLIIACMLIEMFQPLFNNISGTNLKADFTNIQFLLTLTGITIFIGFIAGSYPALYLSSFKPVAVMKNVFFKGYKNSALNKTLIILQFSISIALITCTIIINNQLRFIRNKSWDFNKDYIIHFPVKENIAQKYEVIKNTLLSHPNISSVTIKDCLPTTLRNNTTGIYWDGKTSAYDNMHMQTTRVGYDYFKTMSIELIEGRTFSKEFTNKSNVNYILNEEAVRQTGIDDPIGKMFMLYGRRGSIVGIVEDTYFQSLENKSSPRLYYEFEDLERQAWFGSVIIRISNLPGKNPKTAITDVIAYLETTWNSVNSFTPFEYNFLDETIDEHYKTEQQLMKSFTCFSLLAIFISCLGLFGMTLLTVIRRTKEIGIRKVLGASVSGIVVMLSKEFLKWVLIANIIAWPIAYYAMNKWLQNFAYRIDLSWWTFVLAGALAMVIALLTVSYQAVKAARVNPVEALRYE